MTRLRLSIAAILLAALTGGPALAADFSPEGLWEVSTGESRYRVSYCGEDGTLLCAKLTWLRADMRDAENAALVNSNVVEGARPVSENQWSGEVVYEGRSYSGTVTLISANSMRLHSCAGILCQSFELKRR